MIIKFFLGLLEEIFITVFVNICFRLPVACIQWVVAQINGENKTFTDLYKRKIIIYYIPLALYYGFIAAIIGAALLFVLFLLTCVFLQFWY
jgi:hypothetical protein